MKNRKAIKDLAVILQEKGVDISSHAIYRVLREFGYLIAERGSYYNTPTQKAIDEGLLELAEHKIVASRSAKLTEKGEEFFLTAIAESYRKGSFKKEI